MGHSDIGVTMNTYTHLGLEDAQEEMMGLQETEKARALDGSPESFGGKGHEGRVQGRVNVINSLQRGAGYVIIRTRESQSNGLPST